MKKNKLIALMMIVVICLVGCGSNGVDRSLEETIDTMAQDYFDTRNYVGMSVAILQGDKVSYLNYGTQAVDGDPVSEDTVYEVASLTKPFTSLLLAMESLETDLSIDDPVDQYIPNIKSAEFEGDKMLLKHLATHTSGMMRQPRNWRDGPKPYKNYTYEKLDKAVEKFVLDKKPGSVYAYSNFAVSLIGIILENQNNTTYEALMSEKIFEPMEMTSSYVFTEDQVNEMKATPYTPNQIEGYEWQFDSMKACAALNTTTKDLTQFLQANMGVTLYDDTMTEAMALTHEQHYGGSTKMGLGWFIKQINGQTVYDHDGLAGGFTSYYAFNKEKQVGVVVLCNSNEGVIPLGEAIIEKLLAFDKE